MSQKPTPSIRSRQVICRHCGKKFSRTPKQRRLFCSPKCVIAGRAVREQTYFLANRDRVLAAAAVRYEAAKQEILENHRRKYRENETYREKAKRRSSVSKRRRKESDPDAYRDWYKDQSLRRNYGIGLQDYQQLLAKQGGGCAICGAVAGIKGTDRNLCVDHNHETGTIRGLLCVLCNRGLGAFMDNSQLLLKASAYLARSQSQGVL